MACGGVDRRRQGKSVSVEPPAISVVASFALSGGCLPTDAIIHGLVVVIGHRSRTGSVGVRWNCGEADGNKGLH